MAAALAFLPPLGSIARMPEISLFSVSMTAVPLALSSTSFAKARGQETQRSLKVCSVF
jgi:hypothetical protein